MNSDRILFKAKRKNWKELPKEQWWVQGFLFQHMTEGGFDWCIGTEPLTANDYSEICGEGRNWFCIDESTLCPCTGLKDKTGTLIWKNDVCKYYNSEDGDGVAVIEEDYAKWIKGTISKNDTMTPLFYLQCSDEWEVIGNIFDDSELLEVNDE